MKDRIALMVAALWWGSLSTIGFLVVPLLFARLGDPALAGNVAGRLFSAQVWVAIACALVLLTYLRSTIDGAVSPRIRAAVALVSVGLLVALLQEYAVAPRILARQNLPLWHSIGSALYLAQWLCAGALLWRLGRPR